MGLRLQRLLSLLVILGSGLGMIELWARRGEDAGDARLLFEDPDQRFILKSPRNLPIAATTARQVVVVGDSVTYGVGLSPSAPWPAQLGVRLGPSVEVRNRAIPGYDIAAFAGQIHTEILPAPPALLIYGFFVNDPVPTWIIYLGGHPIWVGPERPPFTLLMAPLDALLHRSSALFRRWEGAVASRKLHSSGSPDWAFFQNKANSMLADLQQTHIPLLLVVIPPHVLNAPDAATCTARAHQSPSFCADSLSQHQQALAYFSQNGVTTIDALPLYQRDGSEDLAAMPGDPNHVSIEGHRRLAAGIEGAVRQILSLSP